MNPWGAPERVGDTHLSNELPNLQRRLRPAAMQISISTANTVGNPARCQRISVSGLMIAKSTLDIGSSSRYSPANTRRSSIAESRLLW